MHVARQPRTDGSLSGRSFLSVNCLMTSSAPCCRFSLVASTLGTYLIGLTVGVHQSLLPPLVPLLSGVKTPPLLLPPSVHEGHVHSLADTGVKEEVEAKITAGRATRVLLVKRMIGRMKLKRDREGIDDLRRARCIMKVWESVLLLVEAD